MFIGEYTHSLDAKGRIIIPSKFRDELETNFYLTRWLDGCLAIFSSDQWSKIHEELSKLPSTKKAARQFTHMLFAKATECTLDNQGRIIIPPVLAKEANIVKECSIIGVNDHIEIWDKQAWEDYFKEANDQFEEVAEELTDLFE